MKNMKKTKHNDEILPEDQLTSSDEGDSFMSECISEEGSEILADDG
jgi:hypothetical protein